MAAALKLDYSYQIEENNEYEELIKRIRKLIFEKNSIPQKTTSKPVFAGNPLEKNDGKKLKTYSLDDNPKPIA